MFKNKNDEAFHDWKSKLWISQLAARNLGEDQAPKNSWLAEGIPNSSLKIDFFCCRGIKSINWMEAPPEAIM